MQATEHISFLIGSGFSKPAGYPTTDEMNQRLEKIRADEICIDSNGDARFLNGQRDPDAAWKRLWERQFVQDFLAFYRSKVLMANESFHYENFYDYYSQYKDGADAPALSAFLQDFRTKQGQECQRDDYNLLMTFDLTFSQLIACLLRKELDHFRLCKPYTSPHKGFLMLVENLAKDHVVHLHSLNHDLYLERLAHSDSISDNLDDGFEESGSPFYGVPDHRRYKVRLSRFVDRYDRPFRLYKLHGSLDHYWFSTAGEPSLIKWRQGLSASDFYAEVWVDGKPRYVRDRINFHAEFLTGTTHKVKRYGTGPYYSAMLKHFQENLKLSVALIVIGYGFKDPKIDEYIRQYFGDRKKMLVIGNTKPTTPLLGGRKVEFLDCGVEGMDSDSILNHLPANSTVSS